MGRLVVATAGGFGREVDEYARAAGYEVRGFLHDLDAYPGSIDGLGIDDRIIGPIEAYEPEPDEVVAIGLGDVAPRLAVAEQVLARGGRLATLVHPNAVVADSAVLEPGTVLCPFVFVGPNTRIGELSVLNTYASIGHDVVVGRGCVMAPYAVCNGRATLEDEVFLATHSTVVARRTVGRGSVVGAGSVVLHDVPPGSLAVGTPARFRPL